MRLVIYTQRTSKNKIQHSFCFYGYQIKCYKSQIYIQTFIRTQLGVFKGYDFSRNHTNIIKSPANWRTGGAQKGQFKIFVHSLRKYKYFDIYFSWNIQQEWFFRTDQIHSFQHKRFFYETCTIQLYLYIVWYI